jgi:two-component system cell cycle response regulator
MKASQLIQNGPIYNFTLTDMDSAYELSQTLSQFFPEPEQVVTGIYELLLNAVEHGNLGIGLEEKTELLRQQKWHEEITRRLAAPENTGKKVSINVTRSKDKKYQITITDQGNGFAWKNYIGRALDNKRPNGRGLWIAFNSQFDRVTFNSAGNKVTCIVQY